MHQSYNRIWEDYLKDNYFPTYVRNIQEISLTDFKDTVLNNQSVSEKYILDFLAGDVFIIRNVLDIETTKQLKTDIYQYGKCTPESKLKANSTIPNFHYQSLGGQVKDGYDELAHSYFFWRWNKDDLKIFERLDHFWDVIKIFNGISKDGLKSNIPKDKVIDRVQVLHYPINVGKITPHCDVARWQKTNVAINLTEIGKDFETGGLYCLNKKEEKVKIESLVKTGDSIVWLPSIFHGVDEPTSEKVIDRSNMEGRWQLLAQAVQSWSVKNRIVSVSYKNFKKNPNKVLNDYLFYEEIK